MRTNLGRARLFRIPNCLFVVCAFSVGCGVEAGPVIAPVHGVVTLDGKPIEGAEVNFRVKDGPRVSIGLTNGKGEYKLTTFNTGDGAIVGENMVSIRQTPKDVTSTGGLSLDNMKAGKAHLDGGVQRAAAEKSLATMAASATIPQKYANPEKSGLKRSVVVGDKNEFNFDLKP